MFIESLENRRMFQVQTIVEWNIVDGFTHLAQGVQASWRQTTAGKTPNVNQLVTGNKDFILDVSGIGAHTQIIVSQMSYASLTQNGANDEDKMEHAVVTGATLNGSEHFEMWNNWDNGEMALWHSANNVSAFWTSYTFETNDQWAPGNLRIDIATPEVALTAPVDTVLEDGSDYGIFRVSVLDNYIADWTIKLNFDYGSGSPGQASSSDVSGLDGSWLWIVVIPGQTSYDVEWWGNQDTIDETDYERFMAYLSHDTSKYIIAIGNDYAYGYIQDDE